MKKIFSAIGIIVSTMALAQGHHPDAPSTHGMLIFGTQKIYASHLPMFHAPHDYQVILELTLDEQTKRRFITDQASHPDECSYTLVPEKFVLPQMLDKPTSFMAVIYRGHFERGGLPITDSISVSIRQVIYRQKFDRKANRASRFQLLIFGNENEQFAAHAISAKPDFDQVIQVAHPALTNDYEVVTIPGPHANTPLGVSGNRMEVNSDKGKISLKLLRQLYLEFDDLQ